MHISSIISDLELRDVRVEAAVAVDAVGLRGLRDIYIYIYICIWESIEVSI